MSFLDYYSKKAIEEIHGESLVNTRKTINGFDVYTAGEETSLCKVRVIFRHGSLADDIAGIHHAFEHMMFKGKNKVLVEKMEALGASLNAYTSIFTTKFTMECSIFRASEIIPLFAQMFDFNKEGFVISSEDWEVEKSVIHSERIQNETDHESIVWDAFAENLFRDVAQTNILGTEESINAMLPEHFSNVFDRMVYAQNTTIAISHRKGMTVGNLFVDELSKYIKPKAAYDEMLIPEFKDTHSFSLCHDYVRYNTYKHMLKFNTCVTNPVHDLIVHMISNYISGGLTAPLFTKIREELGNVYDCHGWAAKSALGHELNIQVGVHVNDIKPYINAINEILDDIQANGISEEAFNGVKNRLLYAFAKNAEFGAIGPIVYYGLERAEFVYEVPHMLMLIECMDYESGNKMIKEVMNNVGSSIEMCIRPTPKEEQDA